MSPHPAATPQTEDDTHGDWADRLALEIALDMQRMGLRRASELTAARLRLVKCQGEYEAAGRAASILATHGPSEATLQAEHQKDVDERGVDGWGA